MDLPYKLFSCHQEKVPVMDLMYPIVIKKTKTKIKKMSRETKIKTMSQNFPSYATLNIVKNLFKQRKLTINLLKLHSYLSSRLQMSFETDLLKNFAKFTGKHLCWSLFLIKLQASGNFIKKRIQHRRFPLNIEKFLRTAFFIEHLWWLLLQFIRKTFTQYFRLFEQAHHGEQCVKELICY